MKNVPQKQKVEAIRKNIIRALKYDIIDIKFTKIETKPLTIDLKIARVRNETIEEVRAQPPSL